MSGSTTRPWSKTGVTSLESHVRLLAIELTPVLADEPQFVLESDDQMVFHQHHMMKNRYETLRAHWEWEELYPINNNREDREKLRQLMAEVDVRRLDVTAVAAEWDWVGK